MNCPLCQSDLRGEPMPAHHFEHKPGRCEEAKEKYGRCYCLSYGDLAPEDRFYGRQVLIEVSGVYDGGLFYLCPDCGDFFHRFPEDHYLHPIAQREMEKMRNEV